MVDTARTLETHTENPGNRFIQALSAVWPSLPVPHKSREVVTTEIR